MLQCSGIGVKSQPLGLIAGLVRAISTAAHAKACTWRWLLSTTLSLMSIPPQESLHAGSLRLAAHLRAVPTPAAHGLACTSGSISAPAHRTRRRWRLHAGKQGGL